MARSTERNTTAGQRYWLPLPILRGSDGGAVGLTLRRPTWHNLVFFAVLATLSHALLKKLDVTDPSVITMVYTGAGVVASVISQLLNRAKSETLSRIIGSTLNLIALTVVIIIDGGRLVPMLIIVAVMQIHNLGGEVLFRHCRAVDMRHEGIAPKKPASPHTRVVNS